MAEPIRDDCALPLNSEGNIVGHFRHSTGVGSFIYLLGACLEPHTHNIFSQQSSSIILVQTSSTWPKDSLRWLIDRIVRVAGARHA